MFLWFAATSVALVWVVFSSPALDTRTVMAGALLPLLELPLGHPAVVHSLAGAVGALVVVMVATPRRRVLRRRLLGIPIGLFLHLVLDGVWADTRAFWWPLAGGFSDERLPELSRGWGNVAFELAGLAAAYWIWRAFGLADPDRRRSFIRTGRLRAPDEPL